VLGRRILLTECGPSVDTASAGSWIKRLGEAVYDSSPQGERARARDRW
jgi:hypothetical protein